MEAGLPEEDSDQAEEGRLLHKYAADPTLDRKKLKPNQRDLLEINDRLVREVFQRVADKFGDELAISHGADDITWWLHRGLKSLYPGHPDLFEYRPAKLLIVIDYKTGYKTVTPAEANLQLRSYGVMGAELYDCEHIVVAITQPRLGIDDRLTIAVYSKEEIEAGRQHLYQIWDGCKDPNAPLHASESACRYCKAKLICEEYQAKFQQPLKIVSFPNGEMSKRKKEDVTETELRQCSDEQLAHMLDALQFAEFIKDIAKDAARERIKAGGMPGYRLGKETEFRKVVDVAKAVDALEGAGLPKEKIMACCSMSLGDDGGISEVYRDTKGGTWKDAKDGINALLGDAIEKGKKKPSIEKVDARKALQ